MIRDPFEGSCSKINEAVHFSSNRQPRRGDISVECRGIANLAP